MPTGLPPPDARPRSAAGALVAAALALVASACAARHGPNDSPRPDASGWVSPLFRDHPLVGKIWDVRAGAFATQADLDAAAVRARFLLVGETHDNPDHHLGQARLVRVVSSARHASLVFEMLEANQQSKVDASLANAPGDALALARAVSWERSGWPPFGLYRPVFEAGLSAGLPIVAGSLPLAKARELFTGDTSTLSPRVRSRLERAAPFSEDVLRVLKGEMAASHCGQLPESMVEPMVSIQRAKDAHLAEQLVTADRGEGAILVAGRGHVRTDVGVPMFLREDTPASDTLSVGFVEVSPETSRPEEFRAESGGNGPPFDFVVFTPAVQRGDPCADFREHQRRRRGGEHEEKPEEGTQL